MEYPDDCELTWVRSAANNPKYSWNKVVKDFLSTDGDYLWSCHNDVCYHPDTLPRLLSWDKPLINALVFMRNGPSLPHIWKSYDEHKIYIMRVNDTREFFMRHPESHRTWGPQVLQPRPDDALAEVDFTSTSCTLIHRTVLEAIKEKYGEEWFLMDDDYYGGGEDRRFFERAREVGFPAYVDRSCIAGHISGDTPIGVLDFMVWTTVGEFLGTGERGAFTVDKITWTADGKSTTPPEELSKEAMRKFEAGEYEHGGFFPDPNYIAPEHLQWLERRADEPKLSEANK